MKKIKNIILDNFKTLFYALLIAIIIRSLLIQPFYIPSSSMEPTLLVGDRIFVTKYTYGYSRHSFPFSPPVLKNRIFFKEPSRGDLVVFKTPADNRTDYIKRLIGLPGDEVYFKNGEIFINEKKIFRRPTKVDYEVRCGAYKFKVQTYEETLDNNLKYFTAYNADGTFLNSDKYIVPKKHYFLLGDNRDCSKDSRFINSVGFVNEKNLVGKARIIFFSNDTLKNSVFKLWNWGDSFRFERIMKIIK